MAHPPGFPTLSPRAQFWGGGSRISLKTAGKNCTEEVSPGSVSPPDGQGEERQKARAPQPCPVSAGVVGLRDHSVATLGLSQKVIPAEATGGMLAAAPLHPNLGQGPQSPSRATVHHCPQPPAPPPPGRGLQLFLSGPDPHHSKLPNPRAGGPPSHHHVLSPGLKLDPKGQQSPPHLPWLEPPHLPKRKEGAEHTCAHRPTGGRAGWRGGD